MGEEGITQGAEGQGAEGQQGQQGSTPAPEWSQTFKSPDDMWKSYTNLKSMYDKAQSQKTQQPSQQAQQAAQQQAFDYKGFGSRLDSEFATGQWSEDTSKVLGEMGIDGSTLSEFLNYRANKQLEPLKPFIEGDFEEAVQLLSSKMDDKRRDLFRNAVEANEYGAAGAIANAFLAQHRSKGEAPKVGQVGGAAGAGYKDFAELNAAMKHPDMEWNPEYQAQVKRKFEATPVSVIDQWNKAHSGY